MLIITEPIVTEKSLAAAQKGVYTFMVASTATKPEIAKAVTKLYGVKVAVVRVQSVVGQDVRRKSGIGKKKDWKKALVTVATGSKIKEFELQEPAKTADHDHAGHDHAAHGQTTVTEKKRK